MRRLTLIGATIFTLVMCISLPAFADSPNKEIREAQNRYGGQERQDRKDYRKMERQEQKHYKDMKREGRKHRKEMRRDSRRGPDYGRYRGYKKRPYDKHRSYKHRNYRGHRYDYRGHWRSWDEWDRYARKNPQLYKNGRYYGRYYREDSHLMFRLCEPGTGSCIFFSIGR
ncbi:hypothetical protein [Desulfotalea psychrophila]|nr:hypothetical protein [Desulfotalea psychrophila]